MNTAGNAGADVLTALRTATAPLHDNLETRLDLLDPDLDVAAYAYVLSVFAAYYAPLEAQIYTLPGLDDWVPALERRRKLPLLERDLQHLQPQRGVTTTVPLDLVPRLDTPLAALGCLYVLEGATLGGRVIARHLDARLGIDARNGGAFHTAYGPEAGRMWRSMQDALRSADSSASARAIIIGAAYATFAGFASWCALSLPSAAGKPLTQVTEFPASL